MPSAEDIMAYWKNLLQSYVIISIIVDNSEIIFAAIDAVRYM